MCDGEAVSLPANHQPVVDDCYPSNTRAGLYPTVLGNSWHFLPTSIRQAHCDERGLEAEGVFSIKRGSGLIAGLICRLLGMPDTSADVATVLIVKPTNGGERWDRTFGQHRVVTFQFSEKGKILVERFSLLEFRFFLRVESGGIRFEQQNVGIRIGPLFIPLPRQWAPVVSAIELPAEGGGTLVSVSVGIPLLGPLIAYNGRLMKLRHLSL